jgi:hypothetical protein
MKGILHAEGIPDGRMFGIYADIMGPMGFPMRPWDSHEPTGFPWASHGNLMGLRENPVSKALST